VPLKKRDFLLKKKVELRHECWTKKRNVQSRLEEKKNQQNIKKKKEKSKRKACSANSCNKKLTGCGGIRKKERGTVFRKRN